MKRIYLLVLILLCFTTTCLAAKQQPQESQKPWSYCEEIRGFADARTEHMLTALNNDSYSEFSRDFSQQMKVNIPENKFGEMSAQIKTRLGKYVSMEFICIEIKDNYITVAYKGRFSQEPNPVLVRSVFSQENGKVVASGFWLTSFEQAGNVAAGK